MAVDGVETAEVLIVSLGMLLCERILNLHTVPITDFLWSRQSDGWASWPIIVLKLKTSWYVESCTFRLLLKDKKFIVHFLPFEGG